MTPLVRRSFGFFFHAKPVGILAIVFAIALFLVAVALPVLYFSILPGVLQNQLDKAHIIVNAAELVSLNEVAAHFMVAATVIRSSSVGSARHYPSTIDVHISQASVGKRLLGSLTTPAVEIHEQVTKLYSSVFFQVDEWPVLMDATRKLNSSRPLVTELISYDFKLRSLGRSYSLVFAREYSLSLPHNWMPSFNVSDIEDFQFHDNVIDMSLRFVLLNTTILSVKDAVFISAPVVLNGFHAGTCTSGNVLIRRLSAVEVPVKCRLALPFSVLLSVLNGEDVEAVVSSIQWSLPLVPAPPIDIAFTINTTVLAALMAGGSPAPARSLSGTARAKVGLLRLHTRLSSLKTHT